MLHKMLLSGATVFCVATVLFSSVAHSGQAISLECGQAPALAGVWEGRFSIDGGTESWNHTRLTLLPTGPSTLNGYIEYITGTRRWRRKVPQTGYEEARILPDGRLQFVSWWWELQLEAEGSEYVFRAEEKGFGGVINIYWSKSNVSLPEATDCDVLDSQLPESINIIAPDARISDEMAAFSGVWHGKWGGRTDSKIAIHSIEPDGSVLATYSWGDHPDGNFLRDSLQIEGKIDDGFLEFEPMQNGAILTFYIRPNGNMYGVYAPKDINATSSDATFVKASSK